MIIPVIMCGGAGTRLWPASRSDSPKPFLPLVDGASTFALTLARIADPAFYGPPVIVAGADHSHLVAAALAAAGTAAGVLLEPEGRDTAAAIGSAAAFVAAKDPDATLLVLAADHVIRDHAGFRATVEIALPAAAAGKIVVFGVPPAWPATGYGYIRLGAPLTVTGAHAVAEFVEKPDAKRARRFLAMGYLWNSGIFLLSAAVAEAELAAHAPEIASAARAAVAAAKASEDGAVLHLDREAFAAAPKLSFDRAVMEKTVNAAVTDARFDWSDLGTWGAVWDAGVHDAAGNVAVGDAVLIDATDNYVSTTRPKVGVVGVSDLVVVATDDAVLVALRSEADRVKELTAAIAAAPEAVYGDYVRHYRPWGHYQSLDQGRRHQVKRILVNPGARLSLQKHFYRAEHWTVVEGVAEVTLGMDRDALRVTTVKENETIHIPKGAIHRAANPGPAPMTFIEVQVGDYLGEDDIVRFEDDYGREGKA
jgi:mannose-1-phosphate guanylyltransferase/mannose-6-phosphate isomerase